MSEIYNNENTLHVQEHAQGYIKGIAKWSKFLSIVGFVMCAFMVLLSFFMGTILSSIGNSFGPMPGSSIFVTLIYLVIAVLYFFPCFYLYRSSVKLKNAVDTQDSEELSLGLEQLMKSFKFVGVYTLVMICIYALFFLIAALGGMTYFMTRG